MKMAREAGFDGIQITAGGGYLQPHPLNPGFVEYERFGLDLRRKDSFPLTDRTVQTYYLEAAEAYRREAEFYKEKAEENIRYRYLYLRLGGEMYEVLEILRRTPCACAPLQEAESRLRQMLEQADEDDCQKGVYDFFRKKKGRPPVDKL